jgi:hypothetical protein
MSLHRFVFTAFAAILFAGIASAAFAKCGGCGFAAPSVAYVPLAPQAIAAPLLPPVAVAPAPIGVDHWDTGGCATLGGCGFGCGAFGGPGCGGFGINIGCNCGRSAGYAPAPLYVVNQGPYYSGPGMMVSYQSYAPGAAYAPAINYPYVAPRYGYRGYRGPRVAYRAHVYVRPRYYGPGRWRD